MRLIEVAKNDCMFLVRVWFEIETGEVIFEDKLYTMVASFKGEDVINGNVYNSEMKNKIARRFRKAGYKVVNTALIGIFYPNKKPYDNMVFRGNSKFIHN